MFYSVIINNLVLNIPNQHFDCKRADFRCQCNTIKTFYTNNHKFSLLETPASRETEFGILLKNVLIKIAFFSKGLVSEIEILP